MLNIERVAVLGSGVMGATIAAHLANAGLDVLLLDLPDTSGGPEQRNAIAEKAIKSLLKMKPAPFFISPFVNQIQAGNFEDDLDQLKTCDWVIEVVIEKMDIKLDLFKNKVAPNLKEGAILSTNTSGLSVNEMASALPPDLAKRFLVTHFFNPPRYMRLLEIVPCDATDPALMHDLAAFIETRLGKGIVFAKDTPNFVANRIGVYAIYNSMKHMVDLDMTVEEVDAVAGPATARPRSAAYRTCDLVGLDTLGHVANNSYDNLPDDEERDMFKIPAFLQDLIAAGNLGNKTGKGFYQKDKSSGKTQILYYDYKTKEYKPAEKPKFASVGATKQLDDPAQRIKMLLQAKDTASEFAWRNLRDTLIYSFNRIGEIADDVLNIDKGMKWGFNWELGPFEMFDAIGVQRFVKRAEADGVKVPEALKKIEKFYDDADGKLKYYDSKSEAMTEAETNAKFYKLDLLKKSGNEVMKAGGYSLIDLGDGVFCLEFHSKMNSLGSDIIMGTQKALKYVEQNGVGLVIGNQGVNFTVGANLMALAVAAAEGEWDDINMMVHQFQKTTMALKYSTVPVVSAPFNLSLGGGCEYALHSDAICAYAETYMGLVEIGVGLIPGGGGTKEMCIRSVDLAQRYNTDITPFIFDAFQNIGMAKVSMSAAELFGLGYMRRGDSITMNLDQLLWDAKQKVLSLAVNYRPGKSRINIPAPGRSVAASIKSQLWNMNQGGFASEYDAKVGGMIADVICGGDVAAGTMITEDYLLQLERECFLKLSGTPKTMQRIQHTLKTGKPLRN